MAPKTAKNAPPADEKYRPVKPHRINGTPRGKPGDYNAIRIYAGNRVGPGAPLFELMYDEYDGKTWEEVGEDVRARPRIGNKDIHLRAFGGPHRLGWYIPKKTFAAGKVDDKGLPLDEYIGLKIENQELKKKLKEGASVAEQIQKMLAGGADNATLEKIARLIKYHNGDDVDDDENDDVDDDDDNFLSSAIKDFENAVGPEAFTQIKTTFFSWIAQTITGQPMPQPTQHTHTQHVGDHPGAPEVDSDDELEIFYPLEVHNLMNAIDWERTDHVKLCQQLRDAAKFLGVHFKQG